MISSGESVSDPAGSGGLLAVSLAFFLCGCIALIVHGASLLTLHAFAAFTVMAVVGASNQLVPVLTGARPAPARNVIVLSAPLVLGFIFLLGGFAGFHGLFSIAAPLLFVGVTAWSIWTINRIRTAPLEAQTRAAVVTATVAFIAAATLGAIMALALDGRLPAALLLLAPAHASLVIIAFASTFVFAVSYRFVPMFSLAHTTEGRWTRSAQWTIAVAGVVGALIFLSAWYMRAAAVIALVSVIAAVVVHVQTLKKRMRKKIDVSLRYASAAWVFAFLAACCTLLATWHPDKAPAAVAFAILGWLSLSILGYSYKVVGFLAWEYARRKHPTAKLPALGNAVPERASNISLGLLIAGTVGAALSMAIAPQALRAAAAIYAVGGFGAVAVLTQLGWRYVGLKA
ncbi:hypothetical protein EPN52_05405 [bacterium]|nr:MAG: hypothetical protein EPN52_05405 [bacterium]